MTEYRPLYFPVIDGLRFFAFLLVFFRHFTLIIPSDFLYKTGWAGVELFFLISGFLLTKLLVTELKEKGKISLRKFFIRRILRIWPLYFFYLVSCLVVSLLINHPISFERLSGNIFFADNWISGFTGYNPNFSAFHLWSISMEEQYYLILPFIIFLVGLKNPKFIVRFILLLILILMLCRYLAIQLELQHPFIYVTPLSGDAFLAGIFLGLGIFDSKIRKINPTLLFLTGGLLFIAIYFIPARNVLSYNQLYLYPVSAIAFSFILVSLLNTKNKFLLFIFTNKAIKYLGKISFGLYVFHIPAIYFTNSLYHSGRLKIPEIWFGLLSLLLTIFFSVLSFEFFEKFFLKIKKRYAVIENSGN